VLAAQALGASTAPVVVRQAPHLLLPGVFAVAAVAGFVLLGEELRDRGGRGPR
jgi:ABC-type dipeptide/oligopeptide/nickel transport system permease subunit